MSGFAATPPSTPPFYHYRGDADDDSESSSVAGGVWDQSSKEVLPARRGISQQPGTPVDLRRDVDRQRHGGQDLKMQVPQISVFHKPAEARMGMTPGMRLPGPPMQIGLTLESPRHAVLQQPPVSARGEYCARPVSRSSFSPHPVQQPSQVSHVPVQTPPIPFWQTGGDMPSPVFSQDLHRQHQQHVANLQSVPMQSPRLAPRVANVRGISRETSRGRASTSPRRLQDQTPARRIVSVGLPARPAAEAALRVRSASSALQAPRSHVVATEHTAAPAHIQTPRNFAAASSTAPAHCRQVQLDNNSKLIQSQVIVEPLRTATHDASRAQAPANAVPCRPMLVTTGHVWNNQRCNRSESPFVRVAANGNTFVQEVAQGSVPFFSRGSSSSWSSLQSTCEAAPDQSQLTASVCPGLYMFAQQAPVSKNTTEAGEPCGQAGKQRLICRPRRPNAAKTGPVGRPRTPRGGQIVVSPTEDSAPQLDFGALPGRRETRMLSPRSETADAAVNRCTIETGPSIYEVPEKKHAGDPIRTSVLAKQALSSLTEAKEALSTANKALSSTTNASSRSTENVTSKYTETLLGSSVNVGAGDSPKDEDVPKSAGQAPPFRKLQAASLDDIAFEMESAMPHMPISTLVSAMERALPAARNREAVQKKDSTQLVKQISAADSVTKCTLQTPTHTLNVTLELSPKRAKRDDLVGERHGASATNPCEIDLHVSEVSCETAGSSETVAPDGIDVMFTWNNEADNLLGSLRG